MVIPQDIIWVMPSPPPLQKKVWKECKTHSIIWILAQVDLIKQIQDLVFWFVLQNFLYNIIGLLLEYSCNLIRTAALSNPCWFNFSNKFRKCPKMYGFSNKKGLVVWMYKICLSMPFLFLKESLKSYMSEKYTSDSNDVFHNGIIYK